jgi:hypothetical protein
LGSDSDFDNPYQRFEHRLAEAGKESSYAICAAVKQSIAGLKRTYDNTKKKMIIRAAEALEKTVSDPHTISSMLTKTLKGLTGKDYVRHCLPTKYKSIKRANFARMRAKPIDSAEHAFATETTLSNFGFSEPKAESRLIYRALQNAAVANGPNVTRSSSVGISVVHGDPVTVSIPSASGETTVIQIESPSLKELSGMVVINVAVPITEEQIVSEIRGLTPGYREECRSTEYTQFISRAK